MSIHYNYLKILAVAVCLILTSDFLQAGDKFDLLVNDDTRQAEQLNPRVSVNFSGEFVIAWADKRNGRSEIFFQYFDSAGTSLGLNRKISGSTTTAPQFEPAIDANQLGQFGSTWNDYRNGSYPFNPNIYYSSIDEDGAGINIPVTGSRPDSTCESPDITILPDGVIIIVWADYRDLNWNIYGQRLSAVGSPIGNNFKINSESGSAQQHSPRVAGLSNGGYVVAWYDNRTGNDDIYGRIFNSADSPLAEDFKINDDATQTRQAFPAVTADGNGRFFAAWTDWRNGIYPKNPDIYFRGYDGDGLPIGASRKAISDANKNPQKDVSICADRMGNLAVVWADSSSGNWDVLAQIFDYHGDAYNGSFLIHQVTTGKQLQPDVATDGYKFFFTWTDSRTGDFDIYVTVKEYNDPTIVSEPKALNFYMEEGGALPLPQAINLTNAGFGELDWSTSPVNNWLSVVPGSGVTPAVAEVHINTDTLSYGIYMSKIRLIDLDHGDSSEAVTVTLNVTAPIIDISPDTLYFKVLAELGNPEPQSFIINNSGSGNLNWIAWEDMGWFAIDINSGVASDYVNVSINIAGLEYGKYLGSLIIECGEAANSPETAWVSLELTGNMSYLRVKPDSLILKGGEDDLITGMLEVTNPGSGSLAWQAVLSADWLNLDNYSGSDYDTINITVDNILVSSGSYRTDIQIYDSASFNKSVTIPLFLYLSSDDTIRIIDANAMPGGIGAMPIFLKLNDPAKAAYIPLNYDNSTAILDSIVPNSAAFSSSVNFFNHINAGEAEIGFRIDETVFSEESVPPGYYNIATLFFTAGISEVFNRVDTLSSDSSGLYVLSETLVRSVPALIPGNLIIGNPTAVDEDQTGKLPDKFELSQNFPNPFNRSTSINLSIDRSIKVSIKIYNLLGQTVHDFGEMVMPAGEHRFHWDGSLKSSSHSAPSGIYFFCVETGQQLQVRKMVLLK